MSENPFSKYDCYSIYYKLDIELKCRRTHYNDLLIEKIKYDALMDRARKYGTKPVYINSTPVGVWAFYIADHPMKWEFRQMPRTTDFARNDKVPKQVGYLKIVNGKRLL